jgi:hypothetical protein
MSKGSKATFGFQEGQDHIVAAPSRARVAHVQGLRTSSAAGTQDHSPRRQRSRGAARQAAIRGSY